MRPPLISQDKQISPGVAFPWHAVFSSLRALSSLCLHLFPRLLVNLWGVRNSVSFTFVKFSRASAMPATGLALTNIWQMTECVLWVKPQSVLPESQDTQHACKKASAKSQVPLEINTSCSPLLVADSRADVNVLCALWACPIKLSGTD